MVIGLVVGAIVLRPLLKARAKPQSVAVIRDQGPAAASADELAELELDHDMGRVSDADYEQWQGQLATRTAPVADETQGSPATNALARAESLVRQFRERPRVRCA